MIAGDRADPRARCASGRRGQGGGRARIVRAARPAAACLAALVAAAGAGAEVRLASVWQRDRPGRTAAEVRGPITGWVAVEPGRAPLGTLVASFRGTRLLVGGVRLLGRLPLDEAAAPTSTRPWRGGRALESSDARSRRDNLGVEASLGGVRIAILRGAGAAGVQHVLVGSRRSGSTWEVQARSGTDGTAAGAPDWGIALGRSSLHRGVVLGASRIGGDPRVRAGARAGTAGITTDLVWWASRGAGRVAAWSARGRHASVRHVVRVQGDGTSHHSSLRWRARRAGWSVALEAGHRVPHARPVWVRATLRPPPPPATTPAAWRWECRVDAAEQDGHVRVGLRARAWCTRGATRLDVSTVLADVGASSLSIRLAPGATRSLSLGERARAWRIGVRHRDLDLTLAVRARDGRTDAVLGTRVTWR